MTDYDLMISRRVLIPGDVNSKMYVRMHPDSVALAKPMPQDGFLEQPKVLEVEKWLLEHGYFAANDATPDAPINSSCTDEQHQAMALGRTPTLGKIHFLD